MIKCVRLTNFFSFEREEIKLDKNLNILIGINGSGKSNLFKALRLLKEGVAGIGLRKYVLDVLGGFDNIYFKGNPDDIDYIELEFTFDAKEIVNLDFEFDRDLIYSIQLHKKPGLGNYHVKERVSSIDGEIFLKFENGSAMLRDIFKNKKESIRTRYLNFVQPDELSLSKMYQPDRFLGLSTLRRAIEEIAIYEYFDTNPRSQIRRPMLPTSERRLLPDGTNLPQILNTIKINNKPSYNKITNMLNEVNSKFKGLDFHFIGGNIELMLEEENISSSIHVTNISDGTLRYLCLLSVLFNPDKGLVVCLDEPETGLHPDMISNIALAIIEASQKATIIISTHSETLLNYFDFEKMRIFEKDEHNSSKVFQFSKDDFKGWYEEYSSGKMWRQGDFGGNRW